LRISIITPAGAHTRHGNRNTATRWAGFLRAAGHRVELTQEWAERRADVMIALHARRSHDSIARYAQSFPERPLIVVLTGTDLYRDIQTDANAQRSLELATCLVVLQDRGPLELQPQVRHKARVIYQSARSIARPAPLSSCFEVVVSGHLRPEKDPFRAAAALGHLPVNSRIRVTHIGGAMSAGMQAEAQAWMAKDPRYRWLGELAHARALRMLARSRVMVISSRMEGGANVVSEALELDVPVVASRIPGNIGMLGRGYPGYYPLGDERALAKVLSRAETNADFYNLLEQSCRARAPLVTAEREAAALTNMLEELTSPNRGGHRANGREPKEERLRRGT
jgi:putative glycosyltransferase (TIGR04348 family)